MDFITTANDIIALIMSTAGLIGTIFSAYLAVKAWIKNFKDKKATEIWALIMEMADAAMTEAEKSGKAGEDKKSMVIDAIKASALAANLDITPFLDQLDQYIDDTIRFVNKMKEQNKNK